MADRGLTEMPESGPLKLGRCRAAWMAGPNSTNDLAANRSRSCWRPTIRYAEEGVPGHGGDRRVHWQWPAARKLSRDPGSAAVFLPGGRSPRPGQMFSNPALAHTYRTIADGGRDAYYRGPIAEELVKLSDKVGGLFTLKDFADNTATWIEPVSTNYRGYDVWELPPNGQGIAALQMLNILEGYDLAKLGPNSADFWHVFLEAKKVAYADRGKYYADLDFSRVPVAELIAKPYAAERRKLIDAHTAMTKIDPGDPKLGTSDTIYLCAVDDERNCVSLIQSNYMGFGSGIVSAELGFGIQNRGCLFSLDAKHANTLEPHKRPFHTIMPAFVTKDGKPWFVFGVMGGDMQPQGQVQVLCNLIDFGMNVQSAGEAPRLEHVGSASRPGKPMDANGGTVKAEPGLSEAVLTELLKRRGHVMSSGCRVVNGGGYQGDPDRFGGRDSARRVRGTKGRVCGWILNAACDLAGGCSSILIQQVANSAASSHRARTACPGVPRPIPARPNWPRSIPCTRT